MPSYTLDGVPLDHPAGCWKLKKGTQRRPLPGARAVRVSVPGRAGELPITGLDHEITSFSLVFTVTGATPTGGDGGFAQLETNLEALAAMLGVRHRLMSLRYQAGAIVRVADVTVVAASEPELRVGAARARLTAVVEVPGVYWRDETTATWQGAANTADQPIATLAGSTAPVTDALIRVTGPATNITVRDVATQGAVGLLAAGANSITASERLLIDAAAMRAAIVTTDTWDLAGGTDRTGVISVFGPGSASRWIHLTPAMAVGDPFSRAVLISCTATGTTAASKLEVRARRSYL
ncbi:hypothetical protein [Nonomuraea wenchangensis]|uniref:Uncharacterized protein n=1 Tax=Nonomuraea wenchangensis TaxID=568860 RepID=A0A1I0LVK1_9ACTN|nr:hypothetical protein [Nonomuraea wenchangensis]SEU46631.1 hypothetical protein SAMN05421811_127100 [Nonomuraea wenchangensis]